MIIKVGDLVSCSGNWGKDAPEDVQVIGLEVCGIDVPIVSITNEMDINTILTLSNGRWAYAHQIKGHAVRKVI